MISAILFLPLISALITIPMAKIFGKKLSLLLNITLIIATSYISIAAALDVITTKQTISYEILEWFNIANLKVSWTCTIDSLTAIMLIVVTIVSSLVHIYSIGYMKKDINIIRFMCYLSLFTFFMLLLVTANNLMQLFCGWEGVGLCSYLLIGFWYNKESANNAAMKAFIVNRVSDVAFVIGLVAIFLTFNSVNFADIFAQINNSQNITYEIAGFSFNALNFIGLALFIGAMGKSAQIGLHIWLPDAMEGPTPVSALIHAATMVTAGVFLIARFSLLYEYATLAREVILYIGIITAVFAGTIAIVQNDIKKIIAYSTCSQLGYMFIACGVGAYNIAIFHLMTHAFFKALLFLSAGTIIYATGHEQDIRRMGGLYKKLPFTYIMVWIGSLALAGIYPFAGYFSKDKIIEAAFVYSNNSIQIFYYISIFAAILTALYSWRLIIKVFHGRNKLEKIDINDVKEPGFVMKLPLFILAIGAVISGYFGEEIGLVSPDLNFWHGSISILSMPNILESIHHIDFLYKILPLCFVIFGILLSYILFISKPKFTEILVIRFKYIYNLFYNKYYFDQIYDFIFVASIKNISVFFAKYIDRRIIDNYGPNFFAYFSSRLGKKICSLQTGYIYHYAFIMILGAVGLLTYFLITNY
jgi:NADH-quinone oxidoreductase subunit L